MTVITTLMALQFSLLAQQEIEKGSTDPIWGYYIAYGKAAKEFLDKEPR